MQVEDKKDSVDALVGLHKSRLDEWETYIGMLKERGYKEYKRENSKKKPRVGASPMTIDFLGKLPDVWTKIWLKKGRDYILLNAGFGSLDTTSDLDVNVVSTTKEVMEVWMQFTRAFVKRKTEAASFCEYWDSNFYYEPGVLIEVQIQSKKGYELLPITKKLILNGFAWTTKDTALYELQCVKAYCDAYEGYKIIVVDGREAKPRPMNMTVEDEQKCYATSLHFAEAFREAYETYMKRGSADQMRYAYLKYAVTKIEGLVSVTSLALCTVFGKKVFDKFTFKKGDLEPFVYAISAYEMLRNLRMHSHGTKYKSKYANRLRYALNETEGLCDICGRSRRFKDDGSEVDAVPKSNDALLRNMTEPIAMLLDFMDDKDTYVGGKCPYVLQQKTWLDNIRGTLEELCDRAYDFTDGLIKEQTSEKKKGTEYVKKLIKG